jgi:putative ABC transport system permease protein
MSASCAASRRAGPPSTIYVRTATGHEAALQSLLAQTANPEAPYEVNVRQPSDVLSARAAAAGGCNSLFLGLGAVALTVGAVGVANIMITFVLERRSEIGLRRALGATKAQIRTQFLAESILLAVIGGLVGVLSGAAATAGLRQLEELGRRDPRRGLAAGLQNQRTVAAISSAVPRRPIGWLWIASVMSSSPLAIMSATIGVSIVPGQTALMRIPRGAYSSAALLVRPRTPCLEPR